MRQFSKVNFRELVKESIVNDLLKRKIQPGQKLSLVKYAEQFETSVTPVREAFSQLEQAGLLVAIPNVGFCTVKISKKESEEIYDLIGLLEARCIEQPISTADLNKLEGINNKLLKSTTISKRISWDNKFHDVLINKTENPITHSFLKDLKNKVVLFEMQYMINRKENVHDGSDHDALIGALKSKNIQEAKSIIKKHWHTSHQFIINQNLKP